MSDVKIDVINGDLPKKCLELIARVYNHPNTNSFTKDYIRFEMQKLLGRDYDIVGFLKDKKHLSK